MSSADLKAPDGGPAAGIAIVTGCNVGLGKQTARNFACMGYHVIMACRSVERSEPALKDILEGFPPSMGEIMVLDLGDLASVKAFVATFKAKYKQLDILVCNGGLNTGADYKGPKVTKQGFEVCFGTNFLGHFALVAGLMDCMAAAPKGARVVNVASPTVWMASNKYGNYLEAEKKGPAKTMGNYAASKIAMCSFTFELQKRLSAQGSSIQVFAVDPGGVFTDIWRNEPAWKQALMKRLLLSPSQGCYTSVTAATNDRLKGGSYIVPYKVKISTYYKMHGKLAYYASNVIFGKCLFGYSVDKCAPKAYSAEACTTLWDLSQAACKEYGCTPFAV